MCSEIFQSEIKLILSGREGRGEEGAQDHSTLVCTSEARLTDGV